MGGRGSGGHIRSGPAPDPNALRRDRDGHEWVQLPATGRDEPPDWPITKASPREEELWRRLWQRPQSSEWEKLGMELDVAIYVRRLGEAEMQGAPSSLGALVRKLGDDLGLSIVGLRANRWRLPESVASSETPAERPARSRTKKPPARRSIRDRFTVVTGDGGS
jgi:hypothetical protein